MEKKSVFLSYVYSAKNAGDLAICLGAIDLLLANNYRVVMLSKYNRFDPEYEESRNYYLSRYGKNVKILEAPFTLNRKSSVLSKAINNVKGLLIYLGVSNKIHREVRDEIRKSDYVIFNGGNLLRCSSIIDFVRLVALHYPIKLAKKENKEYLIFPHSAAKINWLGRIIIKQMVTGAKKVFAREEASYEKLGKEFNLSNIMRSIDLAFFIDHKIEVRTGDTSHKAIAFTFRAHTVGDIKEFDKEEKEKIFETILSTIQRLGRSNQYFFVIQSKKDYSFTHYLKAKIKEKVDVKVKIIESYDPIKLIEVYAKMDLLIGMRLHSIILATSVGTPAYGLFYKEWGLKNSGLMDLLQLPYSMLDQSSEIDLSAMEKLLNQKVEFGLTMRERITQEKRRLLDTL